MMPADPSIAPHGRLTIPFEVPAPAESASLRFEAGLSQAGRGRLTLRALADAVPGPTSRLFPSRFLSVSGRRVEVVIVPADSPATGGTPGVLLVHGHAHHARQMLRGAMLLARHGYATALVSMPGYGLSEGPADFMGPRTVDALSAALDLLERTPGVDSTRIGAWGVSRGATAVTLLAERRRDLAAVIAQAGLYDVQALRDTSAAPGLLGGLLAEVGSDSAAWRARSPLQGVDRLRGRVLVMHGEDDRSAPAAQAHAFCDSLQRHNVRAESHFFAGAGHALPRDETARMALAFFAGALHR
jgi:dipeptidyl aminopeptidase/acylaminoacyl peptidase